jgi:hypothetical protein
MGSFKDAFEGFYGLISLENANEAERLKFRHA